MRSMRKIKSKVIHSKDPTYRQYLVGFKPEHEKKHKLCKKFIECDPYGLHVKRVRIYMESLHPHEPEGRPEEIKKRLIEFYPEMKNVLKRIGIECDETSVTDTGITDTSVTKKQDEG